MLMIIALGILACGPVEDLIGGEKDLPPPPPPAEDDDDSKDVDGNPPESSYKSELLKFSVTVAKANRAQLESTAQRETQSQAQAYTHVKHVEVATPACDKKECVAQVVATAYRMN